MVGPEPSKDDNVYAVMVPCPECDEITPVYHTNDEWLIDDYRFGRLLDGDHLKTVVRRHCRKCNAEGGD